MLKIDMSKAKFLLGLAQKSSIQETILKTNVQFVRAASDWVPKEIETHTGQKWESDDYRLARFVDKPKQVNPNFAYKLIAEVPPKKVSDRIVWCDGGDPHTGHPKVFINLDKPGDHTCGYCGLRFEKEDSHH